MSPEEDFNLWGLIFYTIFWIIFAWVDLDEDNRKYFEDNCPKEDEKTEELSKNKTDGSSEFDDIDMWDDFWF